MAGKTKPKQLERMRLLRKKYCQEGLIPYNRYIPKEWKHILDTVLNMLKNEK